MYNYEYKFMNKHDEPCFVQIIMVTERTVWTKSSNGLRRTPAESW